MLELLLTGVARLEYFTYVKYSDLQKSYCRRTSPKGRREVRLPNIWAAFEFVSGRLLKSIVPMYLEQT